MRRKKATNSSDHWSFWPVKMEIQIIEMNSEMNSGVHLGSPPYALSSIAPCLPTSCTLLRSSFLPLDSEYEAPSSNVRPYTLSSHSPTFSFFALVAPFWSPETTKSSSSDYEVLLKVVKKHHCLNLTGLPELTAADFSEPLLNISSHRAEK